MNFKKNKNKIILGVLFFIILSLAYLYGGKAPGVEGLDTKNNAKVLKEKEELIEEEDEKVDSESDKEDSQENLDDEEPLEVVEDKKDDKNDDNSSKDYSVSKGMQIDEKTGKDKYKTDTVPVGKPIPVEPQESKVTDQAKTATLSVRCDTILNNLEWLNPDKVDLVPDDGVIYAKKQVTFYEGESVFNLLLREMKKNKIHMEFSNTPIYNSAYIEGINNLYEFDCGELSGWMYKVNGWFPNYGPSRYKLEDGDVVEWVYTCDLGADIGGNNAIGGE